ncbi:MAG: ankyrin repeat domain-containing protein [Alphaproteobacteria bacterium]
MAKKKIRFNRVAARNHSVPADEGMQFLDAVEAGDISMAEVFIDKYGPDILEVCEKDWLKPGNTSQSVTKTALMKAVSEDDIAMAEMLMERGANVNAQMECGYTALMLSKSDKMSGLLLDKGAELEATNDSGGTALMWPHKPDGLRFLVGRGANVHARDKGGKTALILIAGDNYVHSKDAPPTEHIELLLDAGADINAQDDKGRTALIAAAERSAYDDDAMIKVACLLKRGADPDIRSKEGKTAAMLARHPRPDLDAREAQQKAVAELLDEASEKRAEKTHKLITEGGDASIVVYKPLQLNLKKP